MSYSDGELKQLTAATTEGLKKLLAAQPPEIQGEGLLDIWDQLWTKDLASVQVNTVDGISDENTNYVFPYEKIRAVVGDGGNWKWPRMWQRFDELERRGPLYRPAELLNLGRPNKNPRIVPQKVLIAGGGPVGMRLAIELVLGGHKVTIAEKRREDKGKGSLGFTNRINRPHNWPFLKQDLEKLNGKELMNQKACYPVFTEPHTSSIGIDELQCLLLKNLLLLGVEFRLGCEYVNATLLEGKGKGYENAPKWNVSLKYDATAQKKFGKKENENEVFGVVLGCDGPRSTVRETMSAALGGVEKRKFMDAVGIVANIEKVTTKRQRDLGFSKDLEDMNRSKMLFKPFFKKILDEQDIDLDVVIYYRAATHNYCIFAPTRKNLIKHGIAGKIYHHTEARQVAAKDIQEKEKLRDYCKKIIKSSGIPFDPEAGGNGGFVKAPNDVMAFDFAECWNCKKSFAVDLPDPMSDQSGGSYTPAVGLCGDSLLEPFWPMGLGLKRGWQGIMDTCYAVDNIYNQELFTGTVPGLPQTSFEKTPAKKEWLDWKAHLPQLQTQLKDNFEYCSRLCITEEAGKGEYAEKSHVNLQLKKVNKDAEKIPFLIEIDPWTRYAPLKQQKEDKLRYAPQDQRPIEAVVLTYQWRFENNWPVDCAKKVAKPLAAVNGKKVSGAGAGAGAAPSSSPNANNYSPPRRLSQNEKAQITDISEKKRESLSNKIVAAKMDEVVGSPQVDKKAAAGAFAVMMDRQGAAYTQRASRAPDVQTAAGNQYAAVTGMALGAGDDKGQTLRMIRDLKAEAMARVKQFEKMEQALLAGQSIAEASAHLPLSAAQNAGDFEDAEEWCYPGSTTH